MAANRWSIWGFGRGRQVIRSGTNDTIGGFFRGSFFLRYVCAYLYDLNPPYIGAFYVIHASKKEDI
jgi:hypothetical protein